MTILPQVYDKGTIKKLAEDKFGQLNQQLSNNKQLRFGAKGSIAVELEGDKAGLWYDFEKSKGGSLIESSNREVYRYDENDLVIRIDEGNGNKRFIQTHIDTDTQEWVNKAPQKGYGLFERGSINHSATVLVVEGEKAVIRAAKRFPNYLVISWQGGTGNIKKNIFNKNFMKFKSREIILWPDNDKVGVEAMEELADHLLDNDNTVRMVDLSDLPEKWDLGDDDPSGVDLQIKLSEAIPFDPEPIGKTVDEIMAMKFEPPKFIIPNLGPAGSMLIAGDSKDGKSYLVCSLCKQVLDDNPDATAFYCDFEEFTDEYQERLTLMDMEHYSSRLRTINQEEYNEKYHDPEKLLTLIEKVLRRKKPTILMIDTLTKLLKGVPDDYVSVDNFMQRFSYLGKKHNCLITLNYHTNKTSGITNAHHRIMGSVGFQSSVDVAMVIERMDPNASKSVLTDLKAHVIGKRLRITDEFLRFNVTPKTVRFELAPFDVLDNLKPNETVKNNIATLLRASDRPLQQFEIVEIYNDSYLSIDRSPIQKGEVSSALSKLVREGIVKRLEPNTNDNPRDVVVWDC